MKNSEIQNKSLDRVDRQILRELQQDARLSNTELARRVSLSATPCAERVKRLEAQGYIQQYQAKLNPENCFAIGSVSLQLDDSRHSVSEITASLADSSALSNALLCSLADIVFVMKVFGKIRCLA